MTESHAQGISEKNSDNEEVPIMKRNEEENNEGDDVYICEKCDHEFNDEVSFIHHIDSIHLSIKHL